MVFSSLPLYLDPPNWNQEQSHHHQQQAVNGNGGGDHSNQTTTMMMTNNRAGPLTSERARLAKLPQHDQQALKCPRCESTNTKFCYFNNYSLTQPRHFCKTCRRYWTRGGALRNVPVGGGCRRNKRTKTSSTGTSSKSSSSSSSSLSLSTSTVATAALHQLPFMSSLHPLSDNYGAANLGLNYGAHEYQVGIHQIPQIPFLGGLDSPVPMLFPFEGFSGEVHQKAHSSSGGLITQLASVKMEENSLARLSLFQSVSGIDQYWNGGAGGASNGINVSGWATDLSGFNSSTTDTLL